MKQLSQMTTRTASIINLHPSCSPRKTFQCLSALADKGHDVNISRRLCPLLFSRIQTCFPVFCHSLLLLLLGYFSRVQLCPWRQPTRLPHPRTLEWVAISFSNARKWKVKVKLLSRVRPSATPWTAAYQAPLSMGFSRQEYWSGVPLPSPCHSLKGE